MAGGAHEHNMLLRLFAILLPAATLAQWVKLTPANVPESRTVACFAQIKNGTLMFSGSGPKAADTWLFHDNNWHDVSALGGGKAPSSRALSTMAAYKDGVVMFGGYTGADHSMNDTWVWDPSSGWSELTLSVAPAGRSYHSMAATEDENGAPVVLLFGGTARTDEAHDTALGDTWSFADGAWTNLNLAQPAAPRPRWGHSLACTPPSWLEPNAGHPPSCTLFGGARLSEDDHFSDTWIWTHQAPAPAPPGPGGNYVCYNDACYPKATGTLTQAECAKAAAAGCPKPVAAFPFPLDLDEPQRATSSRSSGVTAGAGFGWKQSQPGTSAVAGQPRPVGRWSFQLASCGRGTLMATGSIGYRVCSDDTWVFNATVTESVWGADHNAVGIWTQQLPEVHPSFMAGAMMARVNDASLGKGVIAFGGVIFEGKQTGQSNTTWFWPATHCP